MYLLVWLNAYKVLPPYEYGKVIDNNEVFSQVMLASLKYCNLFLLQFRLDM